MDDFEYDELFVIDPEFDLEPLYEGELGFVPILDQGDAWVLI